MVTGTFAKVPVTIHILFTKNLCITEISAMISLFIRWKGKKSVTYREARVYLDDLSRYGSVLGLDSIRGLLRELGNPQKDLKFIHIAGTNGKGSVLAYTSTILSEAGYRTGRYVSPTVVSYLERIQVDGTWISEEMFAEETAKVRDAVARLKMAGKPVPTVFEAETAIAFLYFRDMRCDLVVLEAGLGGALDATNIVENTVCAVFSAISRDHIGVIGNTLEEIAENKAGIIKPGCITVSARQQECVAQVLKQRLTHVGNGEAAFFQARPELARILREDADEICLSYREFEEVHTHMTGVYQRENLTTALEVVRALRTAGYEVSERAVKRGAERAVWPGRFECIGEEPAVILDGAHNEDAALRLRESMDRYFPGRKRIYIMGVFRDKEYRRIAQIMCPSADTVYTVDLPDRKRGLPAEELAEAVQEYAPKTAACPGDLQDTADGIRQAVYRALQEAGPEDVILVFGSLSYLQLAREAYRSLKDSEAASGTSGAELRQAQNLERRGVR